MSIKINKVFWKRIQVYFEIQKSLKFNFYLKLVFTKILTKISNFPNFQISKISKTYNINLSYVIKN